MSDLHLNKTVKELLLDNLGSVSVSLTHEGSQTLVEVMDDFFIPKEREQEFLDDLTDLLDKFAPRYESMI